MYKRQAKFTFRGEEKSALPDLPPIEATGSGPDLSKGA